MCLTMKYIPDMSNVCLSAVFSVYFSFTSLITTTVFSSHYFAGWRLSTAHVDLQFSVFAVCF